MDSKRSPGCPDRQRRLAELQAAGFTYDDISRLSRVTDVASVEAAVVSIDDMASRKVNAVYRFECVSGSDQGDGVALAVRCPRQQSDPGAADYPLVQGSTRPAFRALQDGRPEVKRGASGVESESLRDTAAMRPHRGLMRHRRESFSTGATATDSPLDGATRRAR